MAILAGGFASLMRDSVVLEPYASQAAYGEPNYGTPQTLRVHVAYKAARVVNHAGEERVSRCTIYIDGTVVLDIRDRLTLADGTTSPLLRIDSHRDHRGLVHHHKVYC